MHLTSLFIRRSFAMAMSRRQKSPYWREAATLILAAPQRTQEPDGISVTKNDNFEVLMLKRDASSSFMPNAFVYPGGVRSPADFDRKRWQSIFERNANTSVESVEKTLQISGERPPMLWPNGENDANELSADVGFRICALRETFEESGVLLVTHNDDVRTNDVQARSSQPPMYTLPEDFDVKAWRQRVSSNANDFCELCEEYRVVPNVWALYEWSNWLTPVTRKVIEPPPKPRRFDTMFYICCLDCPLEGTEACAEETTEAHWKTPHDWRSGYLDGTIVLFGPQTYETSKLQHFPSRSVLSSYVQQREPLGLIRYMPVIFISGDGDVFLVLPGDELYPANPDVNGTEGVGAVSDDFATIMTRKPTSRFHRSNREERRYQTTIPLPCGLLSPQNGDTNDPMTVLRKALAKL